MEGASSFVADLLEVQPVGSPDTYSVQTIESESYTFSSALIPENKKMRKKLSGLPFGLLFSPFQAKIQEPLRKAPSQCSQCSAFVHCFSSVVFNPDHSASWTCSFCGTTNLYLQSSNGLQMEEPQREHFLELTQPEVDFIDPLQQPHVSRALASNPPFYMFLIDGNIPKSEMKELAHALTAVLNQLPNHCRVGFISFTTIISLYETTSNEYVSCQVYSGLDTLSEEEIEELQAQIHRFIAPIERSRNNVTAIINYLAHAADEKLAGQRKPNYQRAFGVAAHLALHLTKTKSGEKQDGCWISSQGGHIISVLNGCPNYGLGGVVESFTQEQEIDYRVDEATKFYRKLAQLARQNNVIIDLYCVGLQNFRVRVLQNLVLSNGGNILLVKEFGDLQLLENMLLGINRSGGKRSGSFDIRVSPGLNVSHIIGPATSIQGESSNTQTEVDHCLMSSIQEDFTFSVFYDLKQLLVTDSAYFQFVVQFLNNRNEKVFRVITARLFVADTLGKLVSSLNDKVISVLLAKRFILAARKAAVMETSAVISSLDNFVGKLFKMFRNEDLPGIETILYDLPRMMFMLRRGPLLGPILQHSDDIDYCRCFFLQATLRTCLRFIDPPLYRIQSGDVIPLPLEDLALQSDSVLLLDHHTEILIWQGNEVGERAEHFLATANELALQRAENRFPRPYIMQFKERTSMARWLLCRLIPSHKDPKEKQIENFPELNKLSEANYQAFMRNFYDTDDFSFVQYCAVIRDSF